MNYKKSYFQSLIVPIFIAFFAVFLNAVCVRFRTDENHLWMLWINLVTDWLCGAFLVFDICCYVMPRKELYRLSCKRRQTLEGIIDRVELQTVRYEKINCFTVYMTDRQLFAPEGMSVPTVGEKAELHVAGNMILEVVQ